jgi:hypothetical protein
MRSAAIAKLDKCVSQFIRSSKPRCVTCGAKERLCNGHLFHRRNLATRFDVWEGGNCHTQCFSCNLLHETDDNLFKNWYIREYGLDMFMELRMRHNKIMKIKAFQIEQLHRLLQSGDVESYKTLLLSLCQ